MIEISWPIRIRIHPIFWLLAFGIGWMSSDTGNDPIGTKLTMTILWVGIIFFSVLFHEFGHALTAMAFGQNATIELVAFGGVTHRMGKVLRLWQEFLIVLAGPCFGFILALVAFKVQQSLPATALPLVKYGVWMTAAINVFWTVLNLLPVQPLDGGKLLSLLFEGIFGMKGLKIALFISLAFSTLLMVYFFIQQDLFAGVIFFLLAVENFRAWRQIATLSPSDRDQSLQDLLKEAARKSQEGKYEESLKLLNQLSSQAPSGLLFQEASDQKALLLHRLGRDNEAFQELSARQSKLGIEPLKLLQKLAYHRGDWQLALDLGSKVYRSEMDPDVALTNALSAAALQEAKATVGWLQSVAEANLPHLGAILTMHEFDSVRKTEQFQALLRKFH